MKTLAYLMGSLVGLTMAAQAADMARPVPVVVPPPMVTAYNWTGFYAGIVGGYGFGDGIRHHQQPATYSSNFDIRGGLIGATVGYNYQIDNYVLGLEADYAWSGIKGSTSGNCAAPGCYTDIRSFGTVRARAGYAFDRFLPYVTGGLAMGDVKAHVGTGGLSGSEFKAGWTVGAGIEAAVWQNITAKVEYLYFDLGNAQYATAPNIETNAKGSVVRAGLNYRF